MIDARCTFLSKSMGTHGAHATNFYCIKIKYEKFFCVHRYFFGQKSFKFGRISEITNQNIKIKELERYRIKR